MMARKSDIVFVVGIGAILLKGRRPTLRMRMRCQHPRDLETLVAGAKGRGIGLQRSASEVYLSIGNDVWHQIRRLPAGRECE